MKSTTKKNKGTLYRGVFGLHLPVRMLEDSRLRFLDTAVFAFISQAFNDGSEMSNQKMAAFFDLSTRHIIRTKTKLASLGYLAVQADQSGIKRHLPVEPALAAQEKLRLYLTVSEPFGSLTADDILLLARDYDYEKILHDLPALEKGYMESKKTIKNPMALIKTTLSTGVKTDPGYDPDWWMVRVDALERDKEQKEAEEMERQELEKEAERMQALDDRYNSLPVKEQRTLRKQAIQILKDNGGYLEHGRDMLIRNQIRTILEEKGGAKNKDGETYVTERDKLPSLEP